jgi:hypothetical protein
LPKPTPLKICGGDNEEFFLVTAGIATLLLASDDYFIFYISIVRIVLRFAGILR